MQHKPHPPPHRLPDRPQPLIIEPNAPRPIRTMHVPKRRRQPIDPRRHKLPRLRRRRQQPLQLRLRRIRHPVLPALDPARLRLRRDPPRVAVLDQRFRPRQVFGFVVVRHVDHDAVEAWRYVGCVPDLGGVLRVVEVEGQWDGGGMAGARGEVHEVVRGIGQCPWEEKDHGGGALVFGGVDGG